MSAKKPSRPRKPAALDRAAPDRAAPDRAASLAPPTTPTAPTPPAQRRARPAGAPPEPDTASTSELILPSGRVDRAAIFRAAQRRASPPPAAPAPIEPADDIDGDDDLPLPASAEPAPGAPPQRVTFRLTRDLDKRLDKYLTDRISFMSRSKLQALIDAGGVRVNGRPAKSSTSLRLHDTVEVFITPPPAEDVPPEDIPLSVLYEDEHLVVINKSPDIIVHPARSHLQGTMINALAYHFGHRSLTGGDLSNVGRDLARPGVVHRLDRQTSGVIVFAKTDHAHWQLAKQFQARSVDKRYVAICHGAVQPLVDVIDEPLGPHPSREKGYREKHVVRHDHLGKPAVSIYRVLAAYGGDAAAGQASRLHLPPAPDPAPGWKKATPRAARPPHLQPLPSEQAISVVEVELKTGRTHQIRVHLSHRGFPIVADDMYTGKLAAGMTRVALHAATLQFKHPSDGRPMAFQASLPADMAAALATLANMDNLSTVQTPPGSTVRLEGET